MYCLYAWARKCGLVIFHWEHWTNLEPDFSGRGRFIAVSGAYDEYTEIYY